MDRFDPYVVEQLARQTRNADLQAAAKTHLVRQALVSRGADSAPHRRPLLGLAAGLWQILARCSPTGLGRRVAPHA